MSWTNSFFSSSSYTPLARITTARAEAVDTVLSAIVTGFALLPTPSDLYTHTATFVASDAGVVNAYAIATTYGQAAYADGMEIVFRAATTNTGPATVNVNAIGVANLRNYAGVAFTGGEVTAGAIVVARYDAANSYFRLVNQQITYSGPVTITNVNPSYGVAAGTNTYTVTPTPAPSALAAGLTARVQFTNANTATATLNVNALGAKPIVHIDGSALSSGDIPAGSDWTLIYDTAAGGQWQLLGPIVDAVGLNNLITLMAAA